MIRENLAKALKWYLISLGFIGGCWGVYMVQLLPHPRTLIISVFSWGGAFLLSFASLKLNRNLLFASALLWGTSAYFSQARYIPTWLYYGTGLNLFPWDYYRIWAAVIFVVCVPIMVFMFKKFDS